MRRVDSGYQYDPLLTRHDLSSNKGVYLDDNQLSNAQSEYSLICIGSASRYPLWQHNKSGEFIGGFYESHVSKEKLIAFYQAFKKETQIIGYVESKHDKWGQSKNPFPSSLSDSLPRHVWAKSYEKGSRVYREERHADELKARNENFEGKVVELSRINELMTKHGFGLRSWDDRYNKGVWVCIARNSYLLEEVEDASDAGDLDMIPATDFLLSQDWLPFAIGDDLVDGLTKLENRLSALPDSELSRVSQWSNAVDEALEHLKEVTNSSDYGSIEGQFNTLSSDFRRIWE